MDQVTAWMEGADMCPCRVSGGLLNPANLDIASPAISDSVSMLLLWDVEAMMGEETQSGGAMDSE